MPSKRESPPQLLPTQSVPSCAANTAIGILEVGSPSAAVYILKVRSVKRRSPSLLVATHSVPFISEYMYLACTPNARSCTPWSLIRESPDALLGVHARYM